MALGEANWESRLTSGTFPSKGVNIKHNFLLFYQLPGLGGDTRVTDTGSVTFLSFGPMNCCQVSDSFPFSYLCVLTELAIASFISWHGSEGSYTALTLLLWRLSRRLVSLWEPRVGKASRHLCQLAIRARERALILYLQAEVSHPDHEMPFPNHLFSLLAYVAVRIFDLKTTADYINTLHI